MATKRNTTGPTGSVGLDLDGDFLAAVTVADGRIQSAVSAELPHGVMSDGEVINPEGLGDVLREIARAGALPRDVRLGVANQQIVVRQLELPRIEEDKDLEAAVRFQASETIAMPLNEVVLDFQRVGDSVDAEGNPRTNVVVVAARESMIERLVEAVRSAGLRPVGIDLNAFALVRALAGGARDDSARVYCHLGAITNLAIAVGSSCLFTRPLATRADDAGEIDAFALAEEIRLSIDFYLAQPETRPVREIVLSGPRATAEGLHEQLGAATGLDVMAAEPLGNFDRASLPAGEDPRRHTVALGLSLGVGS
ncbi:MAG TPA: pilus assembly protein PilM [Thermoleophilaceae bacterium]|nr:pilus assembly protein PilM [Thermoleophilaceae bacterium]